MRAILLAAIAAVLVQPFVFALGLLPLLFVHPTPNLNGLGLVFAAVLVVSVAFVVALGVPIFLLLRRLGRVSWASLSLAGFLAGAVPVALLAWPRHLEGYSSGYNWFGHAVDFYIDGVPTIYAWLSYAEGTIISGIHGLVGAVVFLAVWRRVHAADHSGRSFRSHAV